jgi:hypothetical protein
MKKAMVVTTVTFFVVTEPKKKATVAIVVAFFVTTEPRR